VDDRHKPVPHPIGRIEAATPFRPILWVVLFLIPTVLVMLGIAFAVSFFDG
jgi:hypothetical protein